MSCPQCQIENPPGAKFCRGCGVESFARGETRDGKPMFAINVRCLHGVDVSKLSPKPFDGRSL